MTQIGNIAGIKAVKLQLEELKEKGLVKEWELPYENILTRLSAAIFFLTPADGVDAGEIWEELKTFEGFQYRKNEEKKLSGMEWRIEFSRI